MGSWGARKAAARFAANDPFDILAILLIATLIVLASATVTDYAISNDEMVQQRYGELIVAYYASGLTDRAVFHLDNLYLYGGLFDIVAVLVGHAAPLDPYLIRHLLSALCGIAGIAAVFATARLIAGPRAGALAALALALCGAWYGGMFNHTKDVPFAAAMMGALYFLIRTGRDLPRPRRRDLLGFGLLLGAALGLRAAGLVMIGYALLAIALAGPHSVKAQRTERLRIVVRSGMALVPAFGLAYLTMIAAWPWAALDLFNPVRAIFAFAHFRYEIRTLLAGDVYLMAEVPRWYVPIYLLIKLPLPLLAGALLAGLAVIPPAGFRPAAAVRGRKLVLLCVAALFPLACQVITRGPAFTGLRHFLFVVPPLAVLAGIGLDAALAWLAARRRALAHGVALVVAAGFACDASLLIRLHPHQYLYYNALVGGLPGAAGRYVTDYWVNTMHEAVLDLRTFLDRADGSRWESYSVAVCGERKAFEHEAGPRLRWTQDWERADFYIAPTHMKCDSVLDGKVIATIERLGVPIGVVKDRRAITRPEIARRPSIPSWLE
jgi:hypothetical protein